MTDDTTNTDDGARIPGTMTPQEIINAAVKRKGAEYIRENFESYFVSTPIISLPWKMSEECVSVYIKQPDHYVSVLCKTHAFHLARQPVTMTSIRYGDRTCLPRGRNSRYSASP